MSAEERVARCAKHDEAMLPINGSGERCLHETGLWQCWTCQRELSKALDVQSEVTS